MKMVILLCLLVVFGPLLCEENSMVGFRLYWRDSKIGLFAFDGAPEIRVIMHTLVCVLCVLHMFITCVMWRNKPNRVLRGRFNNELMNSIRELMHNSRKLKVEATRSLTRGKNLAPMRVVQGMLIKLRDFKLEMAIWFVLHDMLRLDFKAGKIFSNKRGPVFTVEEILAVKTDDFKPLQAFVLKGFGKTANKSKPTVKFKKKPKKAKVKNGSMPKERVEDMTEMITSMFAPCVAKRQFDEDYEGFVYPKIKGLTEKSTRPLCLPTGGYKETMKRTFDDESVFYSNEMAEDARQTVKAHYMMAGGFANELRRLSDQEQARKEEEIESSVTQEETGLGHDCIVFSITIENAAQTQELGFMKYVCKLPVPTCSLGEHQAEESIFSSIEEEESHRKWEYKDYAAVAVGCGSVAFALYSVYTLFRR
ncbi:uncharacterized protein LOC144652586 isoform X1 [Oculina patagonica]